jgi:hypothetical protein
MSARQKEKLSNNRHWPGRTFKSLFTKTIYAGCLFCSLSISRAYIALLLLHKIKADTQRVLSNQLLRKASYYSIIMCYCYLFMQLVQPTSSNTVLYTRSCPTTSAEFRHFRGGAPYLSVDVGSRSTPDTEHTTCNPQMCPSQLICAKTGHYGSTVCTGANLG